MQCRYFGKVIAKKVLKRIYMIIKYVYFKLCVLESINVFKYENLIFQELKS